MADMIYPDAGQWIDALEAGTRSRRLADRETAQSNFGRGLMTGDYSGAASAIAPYDPNAGLQVMSYGLKVAGVDRLKSTSDALSRGDYAAAAQAAQGDPEARKLIGEHIQDLTEALATHAEAFDGKPPEQWQAIYDGQIKPDLVRRGFAPAELEWQATPENVKAARTQVLGLKEAMNLRKPVVVGGALVNPETHQPVYVAPTKLGPDETLVQQQVPGAQGAQAPPQAAPTPAAAAGDPNAPRGLRNNNPLNLQATVGWDGMTGSDGRYAVFSSPEAGWAAADRNLQTYATKHGLNTVAGVVNRWSPPSENDTAGYIAKVSGRLGVDPAAPLNMADPVVRRHVLEAMAEVENGKPVRFGEGSPSAPAAQDEGGPTTAPGVTVLARGTPKAVEEDTPLTPDAVELLAGKYLNNGTLPPMGAGKTGTRNRTAILNKATELAKGLGLSADDLVAGTASVHAAGKALDRTSQTIAANTGFEQTAVKNADLMLRLAPKGGGTTNVPVVNRWIQAGRKQIAGDPDVTAFDAALGSFSEEYAKVMTGSIGGAAATEGARHDAAERLGRYATQGQLQAGVEVMKQEMANRTNSLREVQEGLRNTIHAGGRGATAEPDRPEAAPASDGIPTLTPEQAAKLPRGSRFRTTDGRVLVRQ